MENVSEKEIERIMDDYGNTLFRICLIMLGNSHDAEDAVQETLIKYLQKKTDFKDKDMKNHGLSRLHRINVRICLGFVQDIRQQI